MFSLDNVIHIIIIFQGLLLTIYILVTNKRQIISNYFLATIICTLSIQILGFFLVSKNFNPEIFQSANCVYGFLYGPLLFLFNRSLTRSDFKIKSFDFVHFILPVLIIIITIYTKGKLCQPNLYIGYSIHILFYLTLCFLEVIKYKKAVADNYSKLELLNLGWLKWTFIIFSIIVFVDIIQFSAFFFGFKILVSEILVYLLILIAINILYFKGFMSSNKLIGIMKEDQELSATLSTEKKFDHDNSEHKILIEKLNEHLNISKTFKNPNLTLGKLAEELHIPKRLLSELINGFYKQNFVDFINTHRINMAKEKLLNPTDPKETILEILYEVGFNSKSSFNTAFKKKTGLTPTEFKLKRR